MLIRNYALAVAHACPNGAITAIFIAYPNLSGEGGTGKASPCRLRLSSSTNMLEIIIPGSQKLLLHHLVMDYNGTLARDGVL